MPLSEHEERLLDQIERALEAEDPKFAHAVRTSDPRVHYKRRIVRAGLGFFLGVALLLAGVISKYTWIGVVGFLVMLASVMWALTSWRRISGGASASNGKTQVTPLRRRGRSWRRRRRRGRGRPRGRATGQGFMERLEERWRRRQEGEM